MPTVSVILPTYNRVDLLGAAIESVVQQTFDDWELIVADDGSTDATREYLSAMMDSRLRIVSLPHGGSAARARNAALRVAQADWVAFLDSDDVWMREKLEMQYRELTSHPECGWSCTAVGFIDAAGNAIPQPSRRRYHPFCGWILEHLLTFEAAATTPTLMVRRSLIEGMGGFDEAFASREDYDLALRLAARSPIHALAEVLTLIRHHPNRTTSAQPRADLHRFNEMAFRKAAVSAPNKRLRDICHEQCAVQLIERARVLSRDGQHSKALEAVGRAVLDAPLKPFVWRGVLGCAARAAGLGRHAV